MQDALAAGDLIDYADDAIAAMGSSGSTTPYATQETPTAAPSTMDDSFQVQYSRTNGIIESSSLEGAIAQLAGPSTWSQKRECGYDAAMRAVQADPLEVTDLYFPLGSWDDATYVRSDRSSSEDTVAFAGAPSSMTSQLGSIPVDSRRNSNLTVPGQNSAWSPLDAGACFGPMQWTEHMSSIEHESFANPSHVYGLPMVSLKMTPSDPYVMTNEMEHLLYQRMGSLYGDPGTHSKVCSRKFGSTLAEWYREGVRQLAHCISDCHVGAQAYGKYS
ncbi:hypothetical protein DPSP01_000847 [Paraphaeosphaeria sporulosa]